MSRQIEHIEDLRRFITVENGFTAHIDYEFYNEGIDLTHTIVPKEIAGSGIAAELVEYAIEFARRQNLKVRPTCSYVKAYMDKHKVSYKIK